MTPNLNILLSYAGRLARHHFPMLRTSTPLPELEDTAVRHNIDPSDASAYNLILVAEKEAHAVDDKAVMDVRVLGWLFLALYDRRHILGHIPFHRISIDVRSAQLNPTTVIAIGERYRVALLRAFRRAKGPTPTPSEYPSPPSISTLEEVIKSISKSSTNSHVRAKRQALTRDGFRCVVTRRHDGNYLAQFDELDEESTLQGIDSDEPAHAMKRDSAAATLAILGSFGLGDLVDKLVEENGVHHLSNILTMRTDMDVLFDNLNLWFEGTENPNEYRICTTDERYILGEVPSRAITFENYAESKNVGELRGLDLPLPDARLLALHATCARVAHMSGAAEYMDKWDRDVEGMQTLSTDGSSASVLFEEVNRIAILSHKC